jgi:class 3 adenylate cyclase
MSDASIVQPAPSFPSGTLTFLFTDIEGSTQRWERDRAAMQDAVRRHDDLILATIESNGGVVFKTVGDAFYALFELAPKAAHAALAVQAAACRRTPATSETVDLERAVRPDRPCASRSPFGRR